MRTIAYFFLFLLLVASGCKTGSKSEKTNNNATVQDTVNVDPEDINPQGNLEED